MKIPRESSKKKSEYSINIYGALDNSVDRDSLSRYTIFYLIIYFLKYVLEYEKQCCVYSQQLHNQNKVQQGKSISERTDLLRSYTPSLLLPKPKLA